MTEDDADEKVCVHVEKTAIQPEDEEFMRQLDRMLAEQAKVRQEACLSFLRSPAQVPVKAAST